MKGIQCINLLNRRDKHRLVQTLRKAHSASVQFGDNEPLELKTGHIARFASGAVVASQGDNAVLSTCVFGAARTEANLGTPLTVEYRQSAAAVGKIPTNYLRRELSQSDEDIITSRVIDRSIRPLIPKGWNRDTQIVCKPLALDEKGDGVILALNSAATALTLSPIPFDGPVGAVRLGYLDGKIIINPCGAARKDSMLNMILAGCSDQRTVMIEMDGKEMTLEKLEEVFDEGMIAIQKLLDAMKSLENACGKPKLDLKESYDIDMYNEIAEEADERLYYILTDKTHDKISRDVAIQEVGKDISLSYLDNPAEFWNIYGEVTKQKLRNLILENEFRCDGRGLKDFRPITINVDVYKKLHGSALFQRGQTQVFSTVTFDSPAAAFHPDSISQMLGAQRKKMFMLHYEFPAFAVNSISTSRGVNRREIGHGALAEKALRHVIPNQFPYSIRLATQVLESNGSSSMATVCSGSLAMYDAGVPLSSPAAGVAIGIITGEERSKNYKILTDLLGIEDYAGDMDFKIAGTKNGYTALQLDVKIPGLTRQQLTESLCRGTEGIEYVLGKMAIMRDRPRTEFKPTVPVIETLPIEIYKRHSLFKAGAMNAKLIEAETGTKITVEDDSHISLFSPNKEMLEEAKIMLKKIFTDSEEAQYNFGQLIEVDITDMVEKGIYVNLKGASQPVFVPNSQLHPTPISHSSISGLKVGQKITVQWLNRDPTTGKIRLSRRMLNAPSLQRTLKK